MGAETESERHLISGSHKNKSPITRLVNSFHSLPGIGPRSAQRLAYHILRSPDALARELAESLIEVKENIVLCRDCQNLTVDVLCLVCTDSGRDSTVVCVVEEPLDVTAIERTGDFTGLYHVLHGVISPRMGIGPEDIKIQELLSRVHAPTSNIAEIIVATNPSTEGEATAMYLSRIIQETGTKVTRLARGLSTGSDLEYADIDTLGRALQNRHVM